LDVRRSEHRKVRSQSGRGGKEVERMGKRVGLLVLAAAAAASPSRALGPRPTPPPSTVRFEIRVESTAALPGARAYWMNTPNGEEVLFLHWDAVVDASAVATADAERGPDGSPQI